MDKPRIVTLAKQEGGGLGFNIIGGEEEVGIFVSVISPEGAAADNGELKVGDMILQVNGEDIHGWSHETAAQALKTAGDVVTVKVVYKPEGILPLAGDDCVTFSRRIRRVLPQNESDSPGEAAVREVLGGLRL